VGDEESGNVVDGNSINERLDQVGSRPQQRQEGNQDDTALKGPRQLQQRPHRSHLLTRGFFRHIIRDSRWLW
jgi:hypothetical protein